MRTVYELMVAVAEHLAEKPVKLRFQHNKGFKGLCRADISGMLVIDLEPELQFTDIKEFLRVFLHEISHAKNHKFIPMELEVSSNIEVVEDNIYNRREAEADTEAQQWLNHAEQNRNKNLDYFEGCLFSLLEL